MKTFTRPDSVNKFCAALKRKGRTIGFVPTMGFLHEGHLSLIRRAKAECSTVVVSVFVNPSQFGPGEDFRKYPRDLGRDIRLAGMSGADVVFHPPAAAMYTAGACTWVDVEGLTEGLCGASRPGHFRGVATVVAKLLNTVMPDTAYFGQKDAQQAVVIRQMVKDLHMPVRVRVLPVVREKDGLAMSSRNSYLSHDERKRAAVIYRALKRGRRLIVRGERSAAKISGTVRRTLLGERGVRIDYCTVVDAGDLSPLSHVSGRVMIAVAVFIGKTRLIDNIVARSPVRAY